MNDISQQIPLVRSTPEPPSDLVVSAHHVVKQYGDAANPVTALGGVSLGLKRGAFTAIMGPSGSGKSTLMHVMAGLDTVSSGEILLAGQRITGMNDTELTKLRRRQIGFIFQAFNLVPTLDVLGNVMLPFELDGRTPTAAEQGRIDTILATLGLANRLTHRPHELSGGQQQRVAIARALATSPDIVFADEPTGALDSRTSREVLGLLREAVNSSGQSIAMVTHDPVAASYADRILFLADGQIVLDSAAMSPEQISRTMLNLEQVSA
ncbi:ABC transporter ATP-binding protein [Leucobacter sp. UCMA 4100]|uniref:ABC transporter ATP-binding protein n=1 Tax=Microbacteriaceae TaxID=85023 RepID=UPI0022EA28A8|nr:ABC transporter ATP-binding protein [Leucobacter sp. UCMA 4100]MDA3146355.1 ABC transporter ATP-binding protein [Leucobacter sp. UCMA 4100]